MKNIIICADDFAQNDSISTAIIELVKIKRLSAVSCMTASPKWSFYGEKLRSLADDIDVGLHFDLTHFNSVTHHSFAKLLVASCMNGINQKNIENLLHKQLDAFEAVMHCAPDYIDGHQHIHVLPNLRLCVLNTLKSRYKNKLPYIRQVNPRIFKNITPVKAFVLRALSVGFKSAAKSRGIEVSENFFGVYSLRPGQYPLLFKTWLQQASDHSLIMCHPGFASDDLSDPIKDTRIHEYNYLASAQMQQDLEDHNFQISRWKSRD